MPGVPFAMPSDTVIVLNSTLLRAGRIGARAGVAREPVDVHVARRHHVPGRRDADLRLREVLVLEPDGAQHGAARRLREAVDDDARVPARVDAGRIVGPF